MLLLELTTNNHPLSLQLKIFYISSIWELRTHKQNHSVVSFSPTEFWEKASATCDPERSKQRYVAEDRWRDGIQRFTKAFSDEETVTVLALHLFVQMLGFILFYFFSPRQHHKALGTAVFGRSLHHLDLYWKYFNNYWEGHFITTTRPQILDPYEVWDGHLWMIRALFFQQATWCTWAHFPMCTRFDCYYKLICVTQLFVFIHVPLVSLILHVWLKSFSCLFFPLAHPCASRRYGLT